MVRRGAKRLLLARRSVANAKVSSLTRAGTGYLDPFLLRPLVRTGLFAMNRPTRQANGFVTFCRGPTFVLLKQAVPL